MVLTGFDWLALAIVALSALLGLKRGLVREAVSVAAWVAAFLLSSRLAPWLSPRLPGLSEGGLRDGVAMVLAFIAIMIAAMLISSVLGGLVKAAGLSVEDRVLGTVFGLLRGGVLLILLVLVSGLTALPQTEVWQASLLRPTLQHWAENVRPLLPAALGEKIQFERSILEQVQFTNTHDGVASPGRAHA